MARADFNIFSQEGGKILGGVQVICNMPRASTMPGFFLAEGETVWGRGKYQ